MTVTRAISPRPAARAVSEAEWSVRVDLAALYRLFVRYGWTDLIYTHIAARVPGEPDAYLINPYGLMFDEITASNLLKVGLDGSGRRPGAAINPAGHLIHSAVLKARPDIAFTLHSHTRAGIAVSAMSCGVLPLSQHAGEVLGTLAYHDYQDITVAADECDALVRDLGSSYLLVMHNHGLLACGRSAAEAFLYLYRLEMACKVQVDVMATGVKPVLPRPDMVQSLKSWGRPGAEPRGAEEWAALLRMLDRDDPSYRS
jgi:ribulose-5-phosphate 4-epimerase/fuculose-1-phosphate aldolase